MEGHVSPDEGDTVPEGRGGGGRGGEGRGGGRGRGGGGQKWENDRMTAD